MRHLTYFLVCSSVAFVIASLAGLMMPADYSESLERELAAESMSFVFSQETGSDVNVVSASGAIHHSALSRRSLIQGSDQEGGAYAEQVLKVGWPFTVARGFIHQTPGGSHTHGLFTSVDAGELPVEGLIPLQPVWPGVIFWGLVGVLGGILTRIRRQENA